MWMPFIEYKQGRKRNPEVERPFRSRLQVLLLKTQEFCITYTCPRYHGVEQWSLQQLSARGFHSRLSRLSTYTQGVKRTKGTEQSLSLRRRGCAFVIVDRRIRHQGIKIVPWALRTPRCLRASPKELFSFRKSLLFHVAAEKDQQTARLAL